MYTSTYPSPLGPLTLQSDGEALTGLWIQDQKYFGGGLPLGEEARDELPLFDLARRWLDAYFAGQRPKPEALPLRPAGSPFRQAVFQILLAIPYGQLISYGEIARRLTAQGGRPASAQAVGGAVGHNPISLIIPCHRVVGAGGSLTGYAGGIERKVWLLQHEGADMSGLYVPARGTAL